MSCTLCALHAGCLTVKVSPRGVSDSPVMFVGEAPGEEEDQQGRAFVGRAGKLLDQAIEQYGLKPCFITNVCRCRPPGNRRPKKEEVEACLPYLKKEIERVRPKIIVCLGNTPLEALTGLSGVADYSGTMVKEVGGIKIFALFHPAYILRSPGMMPKFEMHLKEIKKALTGKITKEEIPVLDLKPKDAFEILSGTDRLVAFDYETTGIWKEQDGHVRAIGFSDGENTFVVNARLWSDTPKFMKWFLESDIQKAAYNSSFEIRWSLDEYGVEPNNLIHDPMLMQHLLDENAVKDLESVAFQHLQTTPWDIVSLMAKNGWNYATVPYQYLVRYCGLDAYATWKLSEYFQRLPGSGGVDLTRPFQKILLPLARLCAHLERTGIKIDSSWCHNQNLNLERMQMKLLAQMNHMKEITEYVREKKDKSKKFEFNPASGMQLRDLLYGPLGLHTTKKTKKGGRMSTDQGVVEGFRGRHPFVDAYLDWKSMNTTRNNFLIKFPTFADKDGLIHPDYFACGTVTGRLAVTKPPAQTFADDPAVRGMVISRFKGGKIVSSDYRQLEMRLLANEANEASLIQLFNEGGDPHDLTALRMFGKGFTREQRKAAKTCNFAVGYGVTAPTLSRSLGVSFTEAESLIERFWKSYPGVQKWMQAQSEHVKEHGWVSSRFGRVRHLPEAVELAKMRLTKRDPAYWRLEEMLRQAGNFPIQAAGADINNLASIKAHARLVGNQAGSFSARLILPIHDSLLIDCPPSELEAIPGVLKGIMESEVQKECSWLKVKLEVDQEIYSRWSN